MPFLENIWNSKMLGARDWYFHEFYISMIPSTGEKFKKIPWDKGNRVQTFYMIWHGISPLILPIETTTEKITLTWYLVLGEIKFCNLKMDILRKSTQKIKKNITILHYMTTFYNVALKIETSFNLQSYLSTLWKIEKVNNKC